MFTAVANYFPHAQIYYTYDSNTPHIYAPIQSISSDASVLHASGTGQLQANPLLVGLKLSLGSVPEGRQL